ncbi:MAG: glycosyltransferase family 4 protein [Bacteroidota bacterium]
MDVKRIIFINQSPNSMLADIAEAGSRQGFTCVLLTGQALAGNFEKTILLTSYNRTSSLSRLKSWYQFYIETKKWLKENSIISDELFIVSNPPFNLYLPLFLKKIRGNRIYFLIYDLYPDIMEKMMNKIITALPSFFLKALNKSSFKYAHTIITPSKTLSSAVKKYVNKEIKTIYNWADTSATKPINKKDNKFLLKEGLSESFIVLYSGNLGRTHDWKTMLGAAAHLKDHNNIKFVVIGEGESMTEFKNAALQLPNVLFFPWQDVELFPHSIASGDIAWVSYKEGFEEYSIPSKLPYYLASGTPVISIGNIKSELSTLLVDNSIGYAVSNMDIEALCSVILKTVNSEKSYGMNAVYYSERNFSKRNAELFH